ncbi:type VI secretion system protein TssA [uncultured Rubinisphaera sp.]|uniref:type VI secretion system protein TssA n=1 Tax=uncultured Rubinisphaera sp. TaxID=1678686 RepID=UPI0030DD74AA
MSTEPILDLELLSRPISEGLPAGVDLREDTSPNSLYYRIKDARSQARAAERQIEMGDNDAVADWRPILQTVPEVLEKSSKDFEMTAYLLESLVRIHGFAGMRDGCRLIEAYVKEFGDVIYPLPDEDGLETRLAPLVGLNGEDATGTLIMPLKNVPITGETSEGAYGLAQYTQAMELEKVDPGARDRRISQGAISLDTFNMALSATTAEKFGEIRDDLREAITAFKEMTAALDEKYGRDSPPSSSIRQTLEEILETLEKVARDKLATLSTDDETEVVGEEVATETGSTTAKPAASVNSVEGIRSREDAFRILLQVAEYFRKAEPHTPISYGIQQVVRWGRLPLPELMKELIPDETSIHQMFRLVGIRTSENEDEE